MTLPQPHRPLVLVLASALALTGCNSSPEPEPLDPERQLELYETTAVYHYQDGGLERAQTQAVKALEIDPDNVPMRRMIGWIRIRMGAAEDLLIAEEFFRQLTSEGDDSVQTLVGLANTQERLGILEDEASVAIASGERYTDAEDPAARAAELAASSRERWAEAHGLYERVLGGPTSTIKALNGLLRTSALLGDYEQSLDWGRQLIEASQAELDGFRRILRNQDLNEEEERVARASENAALGLQTDTHLFLATTLHRLGRPEEALDHMDAVVELSPTRPQIFSLRAQVLSDLGQYEAAIADLDRFLRSSTLSFDHPDVRTAYDLRTFCEGRLDG